MWRTRMRGERLEAVAGNEGIKVRVVGTKIGTCANAYCDRFASKSLTVDFDLRDLDTHMIFRVPICTDCERMINETTRRDME